MRPDLVANFAVDPKQERVRHPYMFGSDEFADFGNVPVFRFDAGADSYEQMQFLISTYENRYIFNNFRRNRTTFNTDTVVSAHAEPLLGQDPGHHQEPGARRRAPDAAGQRSDDAGRLAHADGARLGRRARDVRARDDAAGPGHLRRQRGRGDAGPDSPEPVGRRVAARRRELATPPPRSPVNVALGNGEGRYIHNDYDYTQGYWWSEYQTQVGSYYEKIHAPTYLTEAYNDFVSNSADDYIDGRYKNLNYMSLYPNQVRRLFANMMATQQRDAGQLTRDDGADLHDRARTPCRRATSTANPNPLTEAQYLPWDKYDPSDPHDDDPPVPRRAPCCSIR